MDLYKAKLIIYVYLTPILATIGLLPNGLLLRNIKYFEEIYPAGIQILYYMVWVNVMECICAMIWPFTYTLGQFFAFNYSTNLYWLIYMAYFHTVIAGTLNKTYAILLFLLCMERVISKERCLKFNSKSTNKGDAATDDDEDENNLKNFNIFKRIFKQNYMRWIKFMFQNSDFLTLLSLWALCLAILLSMMRISWYRIGYQAEDYNNQCKVNKYIINPNMNIHKWNVYHRNEETFMLIINIAIFLIGVFIAIIYNLGSISYQNYFKSHYGRTINVMNLIQPTRSAKGLRKVTETVRRHSSNLYKFFPFAKFKTKRPSNVPASNLFQDNPIRGVDQNNAAGNYSVESSNRKRNRSESRCYSKSVILSNLTFVCVLMQAFLIFPKDMFEYFRIGDRFDPNLYIKMYEGSGSNKLLKILPFLNLIIILRATLGSFILVYLYPETSGSFRILIRRGLTMCIKRNRS